MAANGCISSVFRRLPAFYMASEVKNFYEFGNFRFDAGQLQLEHDGQNVKLPPKSLQTLRVLIEQRGKTVTRENLLEEIWAESFVEDANLTVAVSTLRKTLAQYEKDEKFIQTVPHRGYRFVADAREKIKISEQPIFLERRALEQITIEETSDAPKTKSFSGKYAVPLAALVLMATVGAFAIWQQRGKSFAANLTANQAALGAYQKGDALLQKRDPSCRSISYFEEAVNDDANFAEAFAKLAEAQAMCGVKEGAEENVARAIELNPNSSEAYAADGFIRMFRHWDWQNAENSLRRAVALDPNSATAHHWLGVNLSIRGRFGEAVSEIARASEIEPNSPLYFADMGQVQYFIHDYDNAAESCRQSLALDPGFFFATQYLRDIYLKTDDKRALKYELENLRNLHCPPESLEIARQKLERGGFKDYWQYLLDVSLRDKSKPEFRFVNREGIANIYVALGDRENALLWLDKAVDFADRSFYLPYINVDPRYDGLRDDARFKAILQKMNLGN